MLKSTVKSSARMEKREAYRARMVTNGCAMIRRLPRRRSKAEGFR